MAVVTITDTSNVSATGSILVTVNNQTTPADTVWVEDTLPAGASPGAEFGDGWNWIGSNPAPFSGSLSNQSNIAAGKHQHYFTGATQTLTVNTGDSLIAYVYIDPAHVPSEIMLQWYNGSWEHRAYWGANNLAGGTNGTASLLPMGPLPASGQWVRLSVLASQLGLEGSTLTGMAFTLCDGSATWDHGGKWFGYSAPGALAASFTTATAAYNLTALTTLGSTDWAHWGRGGVYGAFDHKKTGASQVSNVSVAGSGAAVGGWKDNSRTVTWSDGTPTATGTNDHGYIWSNGATNTGFTFSAPADTLSRSLTIYCGGYGAASTLTAHLSDSSAPDYTNTISGTALYTNAYTIAYHAASAGQTLTITYLQDRKRH